MRPAYRVAKLGIDPAPLVCGQPRVERHEHIAEPIEIRLPRLGHDVEVLRGPDVPVGTDRDRADHHIAHLAVVQRSDQPREVGQHQTERRRRICLRLAICAQSRWTRSSRSLIDR